MCAPPRVAARSAIVRRRGVRRHRPAPISVGYAATLRRRSRVVQARVCKASVHGFDSRRRLDSSDGLGGAQPRRASASLRARRRYTVTGAIDVVGDRVERLSCVFFGRRQALDDDECRARPARSGRGASRTGAASSSAPLLRVRCSATSIVPVAHALDRIVERLACSREHVFGDLGCHRCVHHGCLS